jgi:hypothetical protein
VDRAGIVILLGVLAAAAAAHTEKNPKRDRLELSPTRARVVLDYAIPAGPDAQALREIFDRDRSGTLDAAEQQAVAKYLATQAAHFASLTIDGKPIAIAQVESLADLEPAPQGRLAVRLTLEAALALAPGTHTVRFADRHKDRRKSVPLTLALDGVVNQTSLPPLPFLDEAHALEITVAIQK